MELLLPRCVVAYDLAVAEELVLVGDEAFEADRASGVDLGGGDADFCAEAVAEAVSEAGGGILIDAAESTSAMKRLAAASFFVMMQSV